MGKHVIVLTEFKHILRRHVEYAIMLQYSTVNLILHFRYISVTDKKKKAPLYN